MIHIAKYHSVLARIGLNTLEDFKRFEAETVERVAGKRDVLRLRTTDETGRELVLFLKRHWHSHKKDALASLLRQGRVSTVAGDEWANAQSMQSAGLKTAGLVAYGEERGLLFEKFSCLLTEAARGSQTLHQFLRECRDAQARRRVFDALAKEVRRMHQAGLSMPDLFTRHIFFEPAAPVPEFCFIDMARLERARPIPARAEIRVLAALHVSAPLRCVTLRERLRFLRVYAGGVDKKLIERVEERTRALLQRKKYRDFFAPGSGLAGSDPKSELR